MSRRFISGFHIPNIRCKEKKKSTQFTRKGSCISNAALLLVCVDREEQKYSSEIGTSLGQFFPPEIICKTLSTQFLSSIFVMATWGACSFTAKSSEIPWMQSNLY